MHAFHVVRPARRLSNLQEVRKLARAMKTPLNLGYSGYYTGRVLWSKQRRWGILEFGSSCSSLTAGRRGSVSAESQAVCDRRRPPRMVQRTGMAAGYAQPIQIDPVPHVPVGDQEQESVNEPGAIAQTKT